MRVPIVALTVLVASASGCRRLGETASPQGTAVAVRELLQAGRFDEVIARVGDASDAESLYLLGRAWTGKAQVAPLPTPVPGLAASPQGQFKAEELRALGFLERAVAARPDHAEAQLALADLLAPHAAVRIEGPRAGKGVTPTPPTEGPDTSVERVLRTYGDAMQADPGGSRAAERLIAFATAAGRLAEADAAFQELLRRRREDPDLIVRYGDFLAGPRASADAALAAYAQALIWRPADAGTRAKMADLHLQAAAAHLARQEYASAEARLDQVKRLRVEESSPQAARARELGQALMDVRGH